MTWVDREQVEHRTNPIQRLSAWEVRGRFRRRGRPAQRIQDVWRTLVDLHEVMADDLQIVVAANDVAEFIQDEQVVLELSEDDRLVPAADLDAIGWDPT